ncbi:MAG TPA: LysM domain-containing protein, partial [Polyangium sp.]|nr:LysM domain-containing protein [Polyangium sp.]
MNEPLELGPPPPIHIPTAGPAAGASAPLPASAPPPALTPAPAAAAVAPTPAAPSAPVRYTVKSGDTLGQIADRNGTTVSEIMKANPSLKNPNQISVGQQLNLPAKQGGQSGGGFSTPTNSPQNRPPATSPDANPPGQTQTQPQPGSEAQPT